MRVFHLLYEPCRQYGHGIDDAFRVEISLLFQKGGSKSLHRVDSLIIFAVERFRIFQDIRKSRLAIHFLHVVSCFGFDHPGFACIKKLKLRKIVPVGMGVVTRFWNFDDINTFFVLKHPRMGCVFFHRQFHSNYKLPGT